MFEPRQFRDLITRTLLQLSKLSGNEKLYNENAVELLMLTAAQETHLGRYLEQNKGPAEGVFQIEPNTLQDIKDNFLKYNPKLWEAVKAFDTGLDDHDDLNGNLLFQIVIARLVYYRASDPLPDRNNLESVAKYWKKHYNTTAGKGTVAEAMANYKRFVLEEKS